MSGWTIFMALSWIFVLGLMFWSYSKILGSKAHHDPDGIGPASPPEPGDADPRSGPGTVR